MTIQSTLPSSRRRPGAYHEFKFLAAQLGLVSVPLRVTIIAEKSAAGTAVVETPIQVFDEDDADLKCGKGSFAALMARVALTQAALSEKGKPEIWVCPTVEPAGGAAAAQTLTVTGPATASGNVVLRIAGRTITIGVTAGDAQNTIATAIKTAIDTLKHLLPVTAGIGANVVTCTCTTKGVNGNDIFYEVVEKPAGVGIVSAQSVAGAGTSPIANPIAALYDKKYHALCFNNHTTGDAAALLVDVAARWGFAQKNYGFVFLGERGSLGTAQTLQAAYNDYRVIIINCEGSPSLPGELAVAAAVADYARENPNVNLNGERLAIYPPSAALAFTDAEVESALNGGITPLTPDGSFVKIERFVTTQITVGGAPFEPLRDVAYPRTSSYVAEQVDAGFLTGFKQEVLDDDPDADIRARVRDMVIEKHRAMQRLRILRDVDSFIDQIVVEFAVAPAGRLVIWDPFRPAGPLNQGAFVHAMYQ